MGSVDFVSSVHQEIRLFVQFLFSLPLNKAFYRRMSDNDDIEVDSDVSIRFLFRTCYTLLAYTSLLATKIKHKCLVYSVF